MMTCISKAGTYLSATGLLAKKYASAKAKSQATEDNILDKIRQADPAVADALKKQLTDSKETVEQLRNGKGYAAQSKKAAAEEKIERIKAEIQMLKTMGGDPKVVAKKIARLAKELAAAVREYASVRGMSFQNGTAVDAEIKASGGNVAASNATGGGTTDNKMATTATASATTGGAEASAPIIKDANLDDSSQQPESAATATTGAAMAEGARQYQESQRQKFKDDLQKEGAKIMGKTAEGDEKRRFAAKVRTLAAQLKAMAKLIKQRLHKTGDHMADEDIKQTNKALADIEKSISDLTGNNMSPINALA